jgi:hypothetical protein
LRSTTRAVAIASQTFVTIPALGLEVESVFGMSESVTVVLDGAQGVQFRVMDTTVGGSFPMAPGVTTLHAGDTDSFTLTFLTAGIPESHGHTLDVQARLKGSGNVTLKSGAVVLLYEAGDSGCPFI